MYNVQIPVKKLERLDYRKPMDSDFSEVLKNLGKTNPVSFVAILM